MNEARPSDRRFSAAERRAAAPHPGPQIARDYLEPLGLDAHAFAAMVGMDGERLAAMLAGSISLDVDAAVRFGRSVGLPAERLMRAQTRHDFARARETEGSQPLPPASVLADQPFPRDAFHGHLARTGGAEEHEKLYFVTDDDDSIAHNADFARVHPVRVGDRLRVYAGDGTCMWAGPVLRNLDGRLLFAFAAPSVWTNWFATEARADFVPAHVEP